MYLREIRKKTRQETPVFYRTDDGITVRVMPIGPAHNDMHRIPGAWRVRFMDDIHVGLMEGCAFTISRRHLLAEVPNA